MFGHSQSRYRCVCMFVRSRAVDTTDRPLFSTSVDGGSHTRHRDLPLAHRSWCLPERAPRELLPPSMFCRHGAMVTLMKLSWHRVLETMLPVIVRIYDRDKYKCCFHKFYHPSVSLTRWGQTSKHMFEKILVLSFVRDVYLYLLWRCFVCNLFPTSEFLQQIRAFNWTSK